MTQPLKCLWSAGLQVFKSPRKPIGMSCWTYFQNYRWFSSDLNTFGHSTHEPLLQWCCKVMHMHSVCSFIRGKPDTKGWPWLHRKAHSELRNWTSLHALWCSDHASLYCLTTCTGKGMPTSEGILVFHKSYLLSRFCWHPCGRTELTACIGASGRTRSYLK